MLKGYKAYQFIRELDETFDNNSLFSFLHEKAKVTVSASEKWIGLCRTTASEAKLLGVSKGSPLLFIKSVTYTQDNEPLYVGVQIFNGENCSFYIYQSNRL